MLGRLTRSWLLERGEASWRGGVAVSQPLQSAQRARSCAVHLLSVPCALLQQQRPRECRPSAGRAISSRASPASSSPRAGALGCAIVSIVGSVADLGTEERARGVDELAADDDDLLAVEELLRHDRGKATKEVALAIDHDRCGRLERHLVGAERVVEGASRRGGQGGRSTVVEGARGTGTGASGGARGGAGKGQLGVCCGQWCSRAARTRRTALAA